MKLRRRRRERRLRAGQYFARGVAFLVFIAIVGTVRSLFALDALSDARAELIDQLAPTALAANDVSIAMLDQETGLRGFVLSGEDSFLEPFREKRAYYLAHPTIPQDVLVNGIRRMQAEAKQTMDTVRSITGLEYSFDLFPDQVDIFGEYD